MKSKMTNPGGGSLVLGTAQTATPLKSRYQNLAEPFCLGQ
jgi:hypothetical protein